MSLGAAVGRIRARQRYTQAEFGRILGVPQSMVSDWERGVRMPTHSVLLGLAQFATPREVSVLIEIGERMRSRGNAHFSPNQVAISPHTTSIGPVEGAVNV